MNGLVTIFQIGDIHFDEFNKDRTLVDVKDPTGSPGKISGEFDRPVAAIVLNHLRTEIEKNANAVVAVCGDLANRGDINQFTDAASYLMEILAGNRGNTFDPGAVHLVPGNHDVDLKQTMKFADFSPTRFGVLTAALPASSGLIVTEDYRHSAFTELGVKLSLHSINTARANGAPRLFPGIPVSDPIAGMLRSQDSKGILLDSKSLIAVIEKDDPEVRLQEKLDVPVIFVTELDRVEDDLAVLQDNSLPIIIAHHGFLPQATPRLAPYTEMVNGGQVRRRLLQMDRPIIYLHGHIHETVVEVVTDHRLKSARIFALSAPLLSDGYNKLTVEFDRFGSPIGVEVQLFSVDRGTARIGPKDDRMRIPLVPGPVIPAKFADVTAFIIKRRNVSGSEILKEAKRAKSGLSDLELIDFVNGLSWSGLLSLDTPILTAFGEREFSVA